MEFCAREAAQIFGGLAYTRGSQGGKVPLAFDVVAMVAYASELVLLICVCMSVLLSRSTLLLSYARNSRVSTPTAYVCVPRLRETTSTLQSPTLTRSAPRPYARFLSPYFYFLIQSLSNIRSSASTARSVHMQFLEVRKRSCLIWELGRCIFPLFSFPILLPLNIYCMTQAMKLYSKFWCKRMPWRLERFCCVHCVYFEYDLRRGKNWSCMSFLVVLDGWCFHCKQPDGTSWCGVHDCLVVSVTSPSCCKFTKRLVFSHIKEY